MSTKSKFSISRRTRHHFRVGAWLSGAIGAIFGGILLFPNANGTDWANVCLCVGPTLAAAPISLFILGLGTDFESFKQEGSLWREMAIAGSVCAIGGEVIFWQPHFAALAQSFRDTGPLVGTDCLISLVGSALGGLLFSARSLNNDATNYKKQARERSALETAHAHATAADRNTQF
jgi:hypothetical protein